MSQTGPRILIVEDEPPIRRFVRISLESEGYCPIEAGTAEQALREADSFSVDAMILDLGLPDADGIDVIRRVRTSSQVPIIVLSARGRETDKIAALDAGADDYLTKPFGAGELLARVRAALRRTRVSAETAASASFEVGELTVDQNRHEVRVNGQTVHLTPTEFRLLAVLVRHAGKVVTHRQLLREVWGPDSVYENQYLRVYMGQLRHKIERDSTRPRFLMTEPGVGYRLVDE